MGLKDMRDVTANTDAKEDQEIEKAPCDSGSNGSAAIDDNFGEDAALMKEIETLKAELSAKSCQVDEYLAMLQRTAAEFDNYKKRTSREKESLYSDAVSDIVSAFLPVVDSIEKALQSGSRDENFQALKDGVELIGRQVKDVMKNIGVEEIKCVNESFDPQLHSGVMHVEDGSVGPNTVVEEFRKGYVLKDRVIRHSMVKVAN